MSNPIERLQSVYQQMNRDNISQALLAEAYHPDVVFQDPLHKVAGIEQLTEDFTKLYRNVRHIEFDFHDHHLDGDTGFVAWQMTFIHPRIKSGKPVKVDGLTRVKITDDLIIEHRDYFDAGQMLYEHVPVIGFGVRKLKERLS